MSSKTMKYCPMGFSQKCLLEIIFAIKLARLNDINS